MRILEVPSHEVYTLSQINPRKVGLINRSSSERIRLSIVPYKHQLLHFKQNRRRGNIHQGRLSDESLNERNGRLAGIFNFASRNPFQCPVVF